MSTRKKPGWVQVRGDLVHRCVLAAAAKPLDFATAMDDSNARGLVQMAAWTARRLSESLPEAARDDGDLQLVWALIDSGGPNWTGHYDDFVGLVRDEDDEHGKQEQRWAYQDLERLSVAAAWALVRYGRKDNWVKLLTEIIDPYAFLETDSSDRVDLLVTRWGNRSGNRRRPLIVELRTSVKAYGYEALLKVAEDTRDKHGTRVATLAKRDVDCVCLNISLPEDRPDLEPARRWSDVVTVRAPFEEEAGPWLPRVFTA
jgi:hypothetical protein